MSVNGPAFLWFFAIIGLQSPGSVPLRLHYGPEKTTLTGHLHSSWRYGPPGFGETPKTDPKVPFVFIELDRAADVFPNPGISSDDPDAQAEKSVRKIQLWCMDNPNCKIVLSKLTACPVTITGQLHHQSAPLEFYRVNMDVDDIRVTHCAQ
jgi:hypothetical protein